jgi:hypothetical protein
VRSLDVKHRDVKQARGLWSRTVKLLTLNERCLGGNSRFLFTNIYLCMLVCGCRLGKKSRVKKKKKFRKGVSVKARGAREKLKRPINSANEARGADHMARGSRRGLERSVASVKVARVTGY